MDKVGGKKDVKKKKELSSDKNKEKKSENKIITSKKMSGGGPFVLNQNLKSYSNFVEREFQNNENKNYNEVKNIMKAEIKQWINNNYERNNLFYIYEKENDNIISIGAIGNNTESYNKKLYLYISALLSKKKRNKGGSHAIYHILTHLPKKYSGICLYPTKGAFPFYVNLGFVKTSNSNHDINILDKTQETIEKLERKLSPITTEFYSTYPDNIIT